MAMLPIVNNKKRIVLYGGQEQSGQVLRVSVILRPQVSPLFTVYLRGLSECGFMSLSYIVSDNIPTAPNRKYIMLFFERVQRFFCHHR